MKEITDPADILYYLVVEAEKELGGKYKKVLNIAKRFRTLATGVHYIKQNKTKWEEIDLLWHQFKHSNLTIKEICIKISNAVDVSPHTVKRLIGEIRKGSQKTKIRIDEKSLFNYINE